MAKSLYNYLNNKIKKEHTTLDLGCGDKVLSSYLKGKITTVDVWKPFNPTVLWDLNKLPLPFKDNEFDNVLLIDVIEHLPKENGILLLENVKKITKNKIYLFTPLFWTENMHLISDPKSPYYQNTYNKHLSSWTVEDFKGWIRISNIKTYFNAYFGEWSKK